MLYRGFLRSATFRHAGFAIALVAVSAGGAARAQAVTATQEVSAHGLDLTSPQDQAKFRREIRKAAYKVCAEVASGVGAGDDFSDCVQESFRNAWPQAQSLIASAESRSTLAAR